MTLKPLLFAIGLSICVSPALAQQPSSRATVFQNADANSDGRITRPEFDAANAAGFAAIDDNGDGLISPDERPAPLPGTPESAATMRISRAQFDVAQAELFARFDRNGDGRVTLAERATSSTPQ